MKINLRKMDSSIVYDSRLKREYYILKNKNMVECLPYEWVNEWKCYTPDGRGQHKFNLIENGFNSWTEFCKHMEQHKYYSIEEVKRRGFARQ